MQPKVYFLVKSKGIIRSEIAATLYPQGNELLHSGVQIEEFYGISVHFVSDDPNSRLYVERLAQDGEEEILPGEIKELMPEGDSEEMIVPGEYLIRLKTNEGKYESFYEISPKHYSESALRNLRNHLEKMLKGLTYQLKKRKSGLYTGQVEHLPSVVLIFDKILERYKPLLNRLESIMASPITDVVKEYRILVGSRRPDLKSQRWLAGKGISRNTNSSAPIHVYEKHSILTRNNIENRWVLRVLQYLSRTLRSLAIGIDEYVMLKKQAVSRLEKDRDDYLYQISKIRQNPFLASSDFRSGSYKLEKDLFGTEKELAVRRKELQDAIDRKLKLQRMLANLLRYEKSDWFQGIRSNKIEKVTFRLLRDPRYAYLYRFFRELKQLEKQETSTEKTIYPHKKNSLLFEYYAVSLCIEALKSNGFEWTQGWLAETLNPLIIDLPSGTKLRFENETHYVELVYDEEVERSQKVDQDDSYSRFVGGNHRRPDIRLSLHRKENNDIVSGLIIEVKYRRFHYLYNNDIETYVMEQCKSYRNIEFYDAEEKRYKKVFNRVVVLYPKQNRIKPVETRQASSIIFVQIEPSDPEEDERPFGYDKLQRLILEFLNN